MDFKSSKINIFIHSGFLGSGKAHYKVTTITSHSKDRDGEHAHLHLKTVSLPLNKPINRIELEQWFNQFPRKIYRAKGFVKLTESPGTFLFNFSYGVTMFERCKHNKDYPHMLVFIGENLNSKDIETTFPTSSIKI